MDAPVIVVVDVAVRVREREEAASRLGNRRLFVERQGPCELAGMVGSWGAIRRNRQEGKSARG